MLLYALAPQLGERAESISPARLAELRVELELLPERIDAVVDTVNDGIRELAERLAWSPFFLYLGAFIRSPGGARGGAEAHGDLLRSD